MKRYDKMERSPEVNEILGDIESMPRIVIDREHQTLIVQIFKKKLQDLVLKNSNVPMITSCTHNIITFNPDISLTDVENTLGKKLENFLQFIKEFYLYNLDSIINEAYKKEVIAIQEYPYSFMATDNPKIISYTFIE